MKSRPAARFASRLQCSDTAALLLACAVLLSMPLLVFDDIYLNNGQPLLRFVEQNRAYFVARQMIAIMLPILRQAIDEIALGMIFAIDGTECRRFCRRFHS